MQPADVESHPNVAHNATLGWGTLHACHAHWVRKPAFWLV